MKLLLFVVFQLNQDDHNRESINNQIKQHEDNIKFLNSQSNRLAESVLDLQGMFRNQSFYTLVLFPVESWGVLIMRMWLKLKINET